MHSYMLVVMCVLYMSCVHNILPVQFLQQQHSQSSRSDTVPNAAKQHRQRLHPGC